MGACYINGLPEYVGQFRYEPPYFEDLRTPATALQGQGANDPIFALFRDNGAGSNGVFAYQFSPTIGQDLFFWLQLPHAWEEGSTLYPHIHWAPMDAQAGNVRWALEYTIAKIGDAFPLTIGDAFEDPAGGVAFVHKVASFSPFTPTGDRISTMIGCRIVRGATNPLDTYPGLAALLEIDFHYRLNTPGSRQQTLK